MSFLSSFGKDFKAVFNWLGSSKGQAVVQTGEVLINVASGGKMAGVLALINAWVSKIVNIETIAAAAGQQNGTGTQKASAVINAMGPQIAQLFPNATASQINRGNVALVDFLNAFEDSSTTATTTTTVTATPATTTVTSAVIAS